MVKVYHLRISWFGNFIPLTLVYQFRFVLIKLHVWLWDSMQSLRHSGKQTLLSLFFLFIHSIPASVSMSVYAKKKKNPHNTSFFFSTPTTHYPVRLSKRDISGRQEEPAVLLNHHHFCFSANGRMTACVYEREKNKKLCGGNWRLWTHLPEVGQWIP